MIKNDSSQLQESDKKEEMKCLWIWCKVIQWGLLKISSSCFLILALWITLAYKDLSDNLHQCMAKIVAIVVHVLANLTQHMYNYGYEEQKHFWWTFGSLFTQNTVVKLIKNFKTIKTVNIVPNKLWRTWLAKSMVNLMLEECPSTKWLHNSFFPFQGVNWTKYNW